jgi:ABC-type transporter Mla subunit MlaD
MSEGQPKSSGGRLKAILFLLVLAIAGLGRLEHRRPDLSPFDGRLFLTVDFRRIGDLKPAAPVKYGDTQVGVVEAIKHDKEGTHVFVRVVIRPECKKYVNTSTEFNVRSVLMGTPYLNLTVKDLNAERLIHDAKVEGTDGIMGAIEKFKDKVKKGVKDLQNQVNKKTATEKK